MAAAAAAAASARSTSRCVAAPLRAGLGEAAEAGAERARRAAALCQPPPCRRRPPPPPGLTAHAQVPSSDAVPLRSQGYLITCEQGKEGATKGHVIRRLEELLEKANAS